MAGLAMLALAVVSVVLTRRPELAVWVVIGILFGAFLVENEIRDQFAVTFDGLVLDYQGKLYNETAQTAASSPFCKYHVKAEPDSKPSDQPGNQEGK